MRTKRMKLVLSSLLIAMVLFTSTNASNIVNAKERTTSNEEKINLNDYPKDTRERYVASLALKYNISYEEADILEKKQADSMIGIQADDEYLRYRTVDKKAGTITGSSYSQPVHIASEISCVWNRATNKLVSIVSLGGPIVYLPGTISGSLSIKGGNIVKELHTTSGRISQTATITYEKSRTSVSVGGDIVSVSKTSSGYKITTRAKTYAITIKESDLR